MGLSPRGAKRALDVCAAVAGLCCFAPLLPLLALAIKLEDGGPIMRSELMVGVQRRSRSADREGRRLLDMRGRLFRGLRFRVLGQRVHSGGRRPGEDPRLTQIGRLLRRTGLEDWPQLWNVLIGQMSLVGPRPIRPELVERLHAECPAFCERLSDVKPGLFGYAQAEGPGDETYLGVACEKVVFDLHYRARLASETSWRVVLDDLDMIASNLAGRWRGRRRSRGQDVIRIEYPLAFQQLPLEPAHLARRTPADLGAEVLADEHELSAFWYPPRRRPFDLPSQHDDVLAEVCDSLRDDGCDGVSFSKQLRATGAWGEDQIAIELPPSLQDVHRLCTHLEPVWQALAPRSADPCFVFNASFLLVEGLARVAGSARSDERLRLTVTVGRHELELACALVPAACALPGLVGVA